MQVRLDIVTADAITRAWHVAPQIVLDELETAMGQALVYLQRETAERTPTAMGTLRQAYQVNVESSALLDAVFGTLSNPLPYALPVELGTKPHYPPLAPLLNWVEVKLGLQGDEAESAALGIQRKIGRVGTPGYGMARYALMDGQQTIYAEFADAARRIESRVGDLA